MAYLVDLTHIHGEQITPDIVFIMIKIYWDKTLLFDLKFRGVNP